MKFFKVFLHVALISCCFIHSVKPAAKPVDRNEKESKETADKEYMDRTCDIIEISGDKDCFGKDRNKNIRKFTRQCKAATGDSDKAIFCGVLKTYLHCLARHEAKKK